MKVLDLRKKQGFSLIELMVVLMVLGTLMTLFFVSLGDSDIDEQQAKLKIQAARGQLELALFKFKNYYGRWPDESEGLQVLVEPSPETENYPSRPFLSKREMLKDPWNTPYQYRVTDEGTYEIYSLGSDGQEGGEGSAQDRKLSGTK